LRAVSTKVVPPTAMLPPVGCSSPAMQLSVVDLPQPLGPSRVNVAVEVVRGDVRDPRVLLLEVPEDRHPVLLVGVRVDGQLTALGLRALDDPAVLGRVVVGGLALGDDVLGRGRR
jgi:hypothetical protein